MENCQMPQENTIDLGKLWKIMLERKKEMIGIVLSCTIIAVGISLTMPVEYQSTTLVQTRSVGQDLSGISAMASAMGVNIGGGAAKGSPDNYMELMKTRHVLEPVIDSLEWDEEHPKPSAGGFAKNNLDIKNIKKTNLIQITGKGRTAEEAQKISKGVVDSFLSMQTDMNKQTQSLLVQFLNERVEMAKKESEDASSKLAAYSTEHHIYSPDDQIKSALEQLNIYDKSIAESEVDNKSAQVQYDIASDKLGEQKNSSRLFQINDNPNVVELRGEIVKKQIELVELQAQYTEENPQVIQVKKDLHRMKGLLMDEVDASVNSNAASVNGIHDALLKDQVEAKVKIDTTKASLEALRKKRSEKENDLKELPEGAMEYVRLKSDSELKEDVYLSLVKEYEKNRLQEAMESMDVQIIDSADLPLGPSGPKYKLICVIGLLAGILLANVYSFIFYLKEEHV